MKGILHNTELSKMNVELPNDTIMEACFLNAKANCFNISKGEEETKLKGISKATIKIQITIEVSSNAIYKVENKYVNKNTNNSIKHHLETMEQYMIAIAAFDDRVIKERKGQFRFYY